MALKIFGDKGGKAGAAALDMPTTQVRMGKNTPPGYDPLASVSIMDQLRNATAENATAKKLPVIGNLPVVKQFQVLLTLLIAFALLALLMLYLDQRATSQAAAASATATEMQMLSQRLARGAALASQGQKQAFATVEESRQRFGADLKALMEGGTPVAVSFGCYHHWGFFGSFGGQIFDDSFNFVASIKSNDVS